MGGIQAAFQAQEALRRNLAAELGAYGLAASTLLGRGATLADVANAAVFAASDRAAATTGTKLNISCGSFID
jgi:3-oxoacyl-[acyl-carrier protein] reductase